MEENKTQNEYLVVKDDEGILRPFAGMWVNFGRYKGLSQPLLRGKTTSGSNLATYIKKHKLGTVIELVPRLNPNSGRMLRMWVWSVDINRFQTWYEDR